MSVTGVVSDPCPPRVTWLCGVASLCRLTNVLHVKFEESTSTILPSIKLTPGGRY